MSVDWFLDWPEEGLYDVGVKELHTCASVPAHLVSLLPQVVPSRWIVSIFQERGVAG